MINRTLTVEDICRKLRPIFGNKIDEIYFRYSLADKGEEKEEIAHFLNVLYQKHLSKLLDKDVLLEPPSREEVSGEYPLATVSYARKKLFPFCLREKDWPRHVCISGMSGSGKTTLAFQILENFIEKEKKFLVFDWKKSFRPLIKLSSDIVLFTIGNEKIGNKFNLNINCPPKGISPKEWINILCDLITESFSCSFGVHKIILETLDEAFEEWGIYQGTENYPTWNHIRWRLEEKAKKLTGREENWLESALRVATILTFGNFGEVVNAKGKESTKVDELLNKQVIFELNSLGSIEKRFFCEFILTYIFKYRKANQKESRGDFEHAILVDEAHNIFLKEQTNFVKESVTDVIYREMREYGTSLICLDQHISKISDTVKGNSACQIAFQQQLPQDLFDISGLMNLRDNKEVFSQLPVGSAIVKLSERYNAPFLIEIPSSKLKDEVVSDEEIARKMNNFADTRFVEKEIDTEFNKDLIPKNNFVAEPEVLQQYSLQYTPIEKKNPELKPIVVEEKIEKKIEKVLTEVQEVLFEFVEKKTTEGRNVSEVEKMLMEGISEGLYTALDVLKVVNYFLEKSFVKKEIKPISEKIEIESSKNFEKTKLKLEFTEEEKQFYKFLEENPYHNIQTTKIYKLLNLSARKGNKIKDNLLKKGLIKIQEQRDSKGWKKIIRLQN